MENNYTVENFSISEPGEIYAASGLVYREEAYEIIGACYEVYNTLGKGFLENVYKDALEIEFELRNIPFTREKKYEVIYKERVLRHFYKSDFIVFDKIVLEVKAQSNFVSDNQKQIINYLAASKLKLGLLVNFGGESLNFKRMVL